MKPQKQMNMNKNGGNLRLQLVLKLDSGRRRGITATVMLMALDEATQTRFDAEVEDLLAQFVRQQVR
jgi:hypothetical protein